jgi:hypothetical protein
VKAVECNDLENLTHVIGISLQTQKGESYEGFIYFDAEEHWHYAKINAYLEMDKKYFWNQNLKYKIPHVEIPCENCEEARRQMFHLKSGEIDEDFKAKLMMDLMLQANG